MKRSVWRCTLQGKDVPDDAESFFNIAKREMKSADILYVSKADISETVADMKLEARWEKCKSIPGTRRFHQFKPSDNNTEVWASINTQRQTDNVSENTSIHQEDSFVDAGISDVIHSDDYIIVEYNGKKSSRRFVGQVNEIKKGEDGMELNVLFKRKKDAVDTYLAFLKELMCHGFVPNC